ncbi:MAG: outer membrane lipid asymmetry maintenance protein MlaD [Candidatus Paracaedibacter sp.]|jgi:phospholipid/cholesterol/gamma-HCH transport system substrate-binding protein
MRTNIIEAAMGAIVLIIASYFLVFAYTSSKGGSYSGYPLNAKFDRIDGLLVGNDTRISGVKVGSITSIDIDPKTFLARVVFTIRKDLNLPIDTVAEIVSESLMGGKYIALVPGGDKKILAPGERITYTQSSVSFETLIGKYLFSGKSGGDEEKPKEKV